MLTKRQADCLRFITEFIRDNGFSPSFEEIVEGLGCTAKGTAFRLLNGLEERGAIRRIRYRSRAIEVLKRPPYRAAALFVRVETGPGGVAFLDFENARPVMMPERR